MGRLWLDKIYENSFLKAVFRFKSGGVMLQVTGSHGSGLATSVTLINSMALFNWVSTSPAWALLSHTGAQYSAAEYTRDRVEVRKTLALAPHVVPVRC